MFQSTLGDGLRKGCLSGNCGPAAEQEMTGAMWCSSLQGELVLLVSTAYMPVPVPSITSFVTCTVTHDHQGTHTGTDALPQVQGTLGIVHGRCHI